MWKASRSTLFGVVAAALVGAVWVERPSGDPHAKTIFPTYSSPIAITRDDRFVWVVNRDNNSVSVLEVGSDVNAKIAEIPVGAEPRCVAITPNGRKVYVTNTASGTVSVIDARRLRVKRTIKVGTEPSGCALTPDGKKLYVANFSSDEVSVIDTDDDRVEETIEKVGPN